MPPRFADLEARTAEAGVRHLANASVTLGGVPVDVIWDSAYIDQLGTASRNPIVQLQTSQIGALVVNVTTLVKGGVTYKVIDHQPDGTGMSLLELQKAA